eukprot:3355751-Rhodomonas_salina.2
MAALSTGPVKLAMGMTGRSSLGCALNRCSPTVGARALNSNVRAGSEGTPRRPRPSGRLLAEWLGAESWLLIQAFMGGESQCSGSGRV